MKNQDSFRDVANLSLYVSVFLVTLHCYYACYPLFDAWGWTTKISDQLLTHIVTIRFVGNTGWCKTLALLFLVLSMLAYRGRKDPGVSLRQATWMMGAACPFIMEVLSLFRDWRPRPVSILPIF